MTLTDAARAIESAGFPGVRLLAQAHADELSLKIAEMQAMQRTLQDLASRCHGDDRPECPILDDLAMPHACESGHASIRTHP